MTIDKSFSDICHGQQALAILPLCDHLLVNAESSKTFLQPLLWREFKKVIYTS